MNRFLLSAAVLSFMAALLHIAIIIGGADLYRLFGAGEEMAVMVEQGSWIPALLTFIVFCVLTLWGLYALSASGIIPRLPFMKSALSTITFIYLLRGLMPFPMMIFEPEQIDTLIILSSVYCIFAGIAYGLGTKQVWSQLIQNKKSA